MEKISFNEDRDASELSLRNKINDAIESAQTLEEFTFKQNKLKELDFERKVGKKWSKLKEEEYNDLTNDVEKNEIVVSTIMEYRRLLELVSMPEYRINEILSHENAHANVAQQSESIELKGFTIFFFRDKSGKLYIQPSISIDVDWSFPIKKLLNESIQISEAPLHYGDKLSADDTDRIQVLKNKLSEIKNT